jgi:carboxylate-amine ligase
MPTVVEECAATGAITSDSMMTIGVEEEFLLVDRQTGQALPVAEQVIAAMPEQLRCFTRREFRANQFELASPVVTGLPELRRHLVRVRRAAAAAARSAGARLVAAGVAPVAAAEPMITNEPRYVDMARQFDAFANDPAVCGCHVHIGVPDRDLAVRVSNHLRLDLPTLQAMTANSPLHGGVDTGHASWRSVVFGRWPGVGPTPYFADAAEYDDAIQRMIDAGVMMDAAMTYWYARLSARYPTIEVRVGDVCPTVGETVLLAGLVRGLVAHAIDQVGRGVLAPAVPDAVLVAAHRRAARDGLDGELLDTRRGVTRPAWRLIGELVGAARLALVRHGDGRTIGRQLATLRRRGNGATRQRRVFARTGDPHAVVTDLIRQTRRGR